MKNFNDIYEKIYQDSFVQLEHERKKTKNQIFSFSFVAIMIGLILGIITNNIFFIFIFVPAIIVFLILSGKDVTYKKMYKEKIIRVFVKEYSPTLEFLPNSGISKPTYYSGEFEKFDRYFTEDLITGTLENGYKINMAEVKTQKESRDEEGHVTYTTIFHGLFSEIELENYMPAEIKIRKNTISLFDSKDKVEMDSSEFEKIFNVYGTNKITTMQLLTADVMEMFINFKEKNKIVPELTIKNNKLYIRYATGSIFEATFLKNALDFDTLLKYYNVINFTLDLTEKLIRNIKESDL